MSDQVFDVLREQIERGVRVPRARLVQEQIADELSVSRTPVREALSRLSHSGLATWVPGRGYLVSEVQEREVHDVRGVREVLETAALLEAIPHYTAIDIAFLRAVYQEMVEADASADYFDLTRRFHLSLASPCPNKLLLKYLADVWTLPMSVKVTAKYATGKQGIAVMIRDHGEIIDAIESSTPERAVDLLKAHICTVYPDDLVAVNTATANK